MCCRPLPSRAPAVLAGTFRDAYCIAIRCAAYGMRQRRAIDPCRERAARSPRYAKKRAAAPFSRRRIGVWLSGWSNERASLPSPQPSPHGRGSSLAAVEGTSPLHPLADAVTPRGKLAKASLLGEGQGEGSDAHSILTPRSQPSAFPRITPRSPRCELTASRDLASAWPRNKWRGRAWFYRRARRLCPSSSRFCAPRS